MNNDIVKLSKEEGNLEFINISNSLAVAKIGLQGGHVVWWKPKSIKEDVLWLSTSARYEKGRSIRGGVPICWPWFGHHPTPSQDQIKQLTYDYELELTIVVGDSLSLNLKTTNLSNHPFTISEGYHTYFYVSDIENIKVTGLENSVYTDKFDNFNRGIEKGSILFNGPFDRVYSNTSNDCYIEDEGLNRVITVKKSNSNTTVVWTPWEKKSKEMGDMGEESEWRRMVCVETANLLENAIVIYPGLSHSVSTEYSVQEY